MIAAIWCAFGLLAIFVVVKVASEWLAATHPSMTAAERAEEIGRARTAALAVLAGGLAAIGAYYTHRSFGLSRQGQITERFTRAVDQLGHPESGDVRLGGIYALERLARESRDDHGPIVEILTAFVRKRAPVVPEEFEEALLDHAPDTYPKPPSADVQAALTVLGRRTTDFDPPAPWRLDLASVYLPRADLKNARLGGADLSYAVLDEADLARSDLSGARLTGARLCSADVRGAHLLKTNLAEGKLNNVRLGRARLSEVNLEGAALIRADLNSAFLRNANLDAADLTHSDLREADMEGATLVAANLNGARLDSSNFIGTQLAGASFEGACYSPTTRWPVGFIPENAGGVRVDNGSGRS